MRPWKILAVLTACIASTSAQDALTSLASHMPKCALACFTQELPKSSCAENLTSACLCSNIKLNAAVALCAQKTCTVYEMLVTKNVSSKGCGVPVRDKGTKFIIIAMCGIFISIASYILRLFASLGKGGRQLAWDDATMGIVLALAIPPAAFAPLLVQNGLGRDMWTLKAEEITNVLRYYFYGEIFYVTALGFSKISILFFYLRVFPAKSFRMLTYGIMGLSLAYTIAFFFATLFQCAPISQAWTQWDRLHAGTCNNIHLQGWIAAAINIFLDIVVMILPLKHLAGLQMNMTKKVMVMSMFSVGIFVVAVSIVRLESLIHFANTKNITWDYFEAGYWSLIEINVSIVCGDMPAHRLLLARAWPKIRTTFHSSHDSSSLDKSGFQSRHKGSVQLSSGPLNKTPQIKVKPKTDDESDFVPLVNMEHKRGVASLAESTEHEKSSKGWIMRTSSVELNNHPVSTANSAGRNDAPPGWMVDKATTSKDHI